MRNLVSFDVTWMSVFAAMLVTTVTQAEDFADRSAIDWQSSYQRAAEDAIREGKPVLVKVSASWCGPCKQMKQLTFSDSRIVELVRSEFIAVSIDADEQPEFVSGFMVEAFPTTMIIAPDRTILKRLKGFQSADTLLPTLTSLSRNQASTRSAASNPAVSALEPVNGPKYGFDGYCLVSILEETKVRKGLPQFTAVHRGQTVCFQSEENRQLFLADPDKYWPVADGQCLVSSREGSFPGPGDPRMAVTWRGRIWMFTDRERQRRFMQAPSYYANEM